MKVISLFVLANVLAVTAFAEPKNVESALASHQDALNVNKDQPFYCADHQMLTNVEQDAILKQKNTMTRILTAVKKFGVDAVANDKEVQTQLILYAALQSLELDEAGVPKALWASRFSSVTDPVTRSNVQKWAKYALSPTLTLVHTPRVTYPTLLDADGQLVPPSQLSSQFTQREIDGHAYMLSPLDLWADLLSNGHSLSRPAADSLPSTWPSQSVRDANGVHGPIFTNCYFEILMVLTSLFPRDHRHNLLYALDERRQLTDMDEDYHSYIKIWKDALNMSDPVIVRPQYTRDLSAYVGQILCVHADDDEDLLLEEASHCMLPMPRTWCPPMDRDMFCYYELNGYGMKTGAQRPRISVYQQLPDSKPPVYTVRSVHLPTREILLEMQQIKQF